MSPGLVEATTGVSISIARDPALVRTVRLVAAAVARRGTDDEEFVEDVRLAVGEACALLMSATEGSLAPVTVLMQPGDALRVQVSTPVGADHADDAPDGSRDEGDLEPLALLRGLGGEVVLRRDAEHTMLSMVWPQP